MSDTINAYLSALCASLINECGGLVSAALECDVSKSQLQRACDPLHDYTLKASTIWHLEQACGRPIVSEGLLDLHRNRVPSDKSPLILGIDLSHSASVLGVSVAKATADGLVTVNEFMEITDLSVDVRRNLSWITAKARHRMSQEVTN